MADYHNGILWLQPGILYAIALKKTGKTQEARRVLMRIAHQIVKYQGVFEIYEKSGAPVRRFLYRSEEPFAWSAGLYVWAYHRIFGTLKE